MRVLSILRSRNIDFSTFESLEAVPCYSVLYTDYEYYVELVDERDDVEVVYDPERTCRGLEKSILLSMFKNEYSVVVVGIDPGRSPYYVILGDEEILEHGYTSEADMVDRLKGALNCYPAKRKVVRVGGGFNGWKIVLKMRGRVDAAIEVVDESGEDLPYSYLLKMSERGGRGRKLRTKDAYDALKIALREGVEVE